MKYTSQEGASSQKVGVIVTETETEGHSLQYKEKGGSLIEVLILQGILSIIGFALGDLMLQTSRNVLYLPTESTPELR